MIPIRALLVMTEDLGFVFHDELHLLAEQDDPDQQPDEGWGLTFPSEVATLPPVTVDRA